MKNVIYILLLTLIFCFPALGQDDIDSLTRVLENTAGPARIELLTGLADKVISTDFEAAAGYLDEAQIWADSLLDENASAEINYLRGKLEFVQYHYTGALPYFEKALNSIDNIDDLQTRGSLHYYIGVCLGETGEYDRAVKLMKTGSEYGKQTGNKGIEAGCLNGIGGMSFYRGKYDEAAEYFILAAGIFEDTGDTLRAARTYTNIGLAYKSLEKYDQALEQMFYAVKILKKIRKENLAGIDYSNIGAIFLIREDYTKALEYFELSEKLLRAAGNNFDLTLPLTNIGNISYITGNYRKAREYFGNALELDRKNGNRAGIIENSLGLGRTCLKMGRPAEAEILLKKGVSTAEEIGASELIADGYNLLSEFYEQKGDPVAVLNYHKKFKAVADSVFNLDMSEKCAELQARYNSEKNAKEIELLKKENHIRELDLARVRIQRFFLIVGLVLGIGFMAAILYLYRQKTIAHHELELAIKEIKVLKDLLPICSNCKKIREDGGYWSQLEEYLAAHTGAKFTHGLCPDCAKELYGDFLDRKKGGSSA